MESTENALITDSQSPLSCKHFSAVQRDDVGAIVTHRLQAVVERRLLDAVEGGPDVTREGSLLQDPALGELGTGRDAEADRALWGATVAFYYVRVVGCNGISISCIKMGPNCSCLMNWLCNA
jgi:hypothetical protein